ncbi:MAG: aminotransferase class V-fold PLP-dependent enzyme [Bacteroidetes bacterium]|nr:aminotransferase class V-fold PLP-dependent enzyme [Bacteroidota bacterium]
MSSRRTFLQQFGLGISLPTLAGFSFPQEKRSPFPTGYVQDEAYWKAIRSQFPLTTDRTYLNTGTFGPAPFSVLDAIEKSNRDINTSGEYGNSDQERIQLTQFFGIKPTELSITHNTTEGINILAWGIPLQAGDEVILTSHEHVGNALPWLNRAKFDGIVLQTFEPKGTQEENLTEVQKLINPKTKVIALPHVTCTTGLVFPIQEICKLAQTHGILTAIDGAHGAGTFDLDLHALGCDFYAGCFHKWMLGPSGTAFLYVREESLEKLRPIMIGGHSDTGWDMTVSPPTLTGYVPSARRFDYGTQSKSLAVGMVSATEFHAKIGKSNIEARLRTLNQYLLDGLSDMSSKLNILTPVEKESRISLLSFRPKNMSYQTCGNALGNAGFRIREIPEGGVNAIRISTHIYNTKEELDAFLLCLQQILS